MISDLIAKSVKIAWVWTVAHPFKVTIVALIYSTAYALLARFGIAGWLAAFFCGSTMSGVVLLLRRQNMARVARVAALTILGTFIGATCLGQIILSQLYLYDHGFGEGDKSFVMGAIIGALLGALLAELSRKSHE